MSNRVNTTSQNEDNQINILLVEDQAADLILLKKKIEKQWPEFQMTSANTIHEAEDAFIQNQFDAVILDLNLPDIDGVDAIVEMRKFNTNTPIIVLTGSLTSDNADKILKAGANNIFAKSELVTNDDFYNILAQNIGING